MLGRWPLQVKQPDGQMECVRSEGHGVPRSPSSNPSSANRRAWAVLGPPELPQTSALRLKPISDGAWPSGSADWTLCRPVPSHHPGPPPDSPQRAGSRLPYRQAGVKQQRPDAAHGVPSSQAGERRPLLHQPGQPGAGALADLSARVLELRDRASVRRRAERTRGAAAARTRSTDAGLRGRPAPPQAFPAVPREPTPHLF